MKVILVLVIFGIAIVQTSDVPDDVEKTTKDSEYDVTITTVSEDSRIMRPIFPKTKFLFTTKSTRSTNITTPITRSSKKPAYKIIKKAVKIRNKNDWKTPTARPSLMKYTKFTINPITSFNTQRYLINLKKESSEDEDDSSEDETSTAKEKDNDEMKRVKTLIHRFHKLGSKNSKEENISKSKEAAVKFNMRKDFTTDKIMHNDAKFSSEETEDREEFIFLAPKKVKGHAVKHTDDSDESEETTTIMLNKEIKSRQKRSINVIEEENLGTTVSGFKFTGKVSALNSDFVFRNIHT